MAVIYTVEPSVTALLNILVHRRRLALPSPHHAVAIVLPDDLRAERFDPAAHAGQEL